MKVLLYSPNLDGHPQVYCRVIGDILLEHGAKLVIATSNTDCWPEKWPDLAPFSSRDDVQVISTKECSRTENPHLKAEEMRGIQDDFDIGSTLFVEPEFFRDEFVRISRRETKPLLGYNAGIFGGTTQWYPGEDFYSGRRIAAFEGSIRANLGKLKRRLLQPWAFDKYFFERVLVGQRILDAVIVKDERVAEKFAGSVRWLPEIYKVFNTNESDEGQREFNRLKPVLDGFRRKFDADDLVLYFGAGVWYKGYDYFMQLLIGDETSAGIHAGAGIRYQQGKQFIGDLESQRRILLEEGRLFETNGYVRSHNLIDEVFKSARRFVSTHRLTVSSGTMLQAMDHGLPVLVPDTGVVGYRAREFKLGKTYRYCDSDDLVRQWKVFKTEPIEQFQEPIKSFMRRFDRSAVEQLFVRTLIKRS